MSTMPAADHVRPGPPAAGVERMEAYFRETAFAPHRHDTYAVGITLHGIQRFRYRGAGRASVAGQLFVLHPDEVHDGRPGNERGYGYRIAYVDPAMIGAASGDAPLPFLGQPVSDDDRLRSAILGLVGELDDPLDEVRVTSAVVALADAMSAAAGDGTRVAGAGVDRRAVAIARDCLSESLDGTITTHDLEAATGLDRWTLARQFRRACGVSPHRFGLLRRLDRARAMIDRGEALVEVAYALGFADQSHLTRQFRRAYGVTPGRWRTLARASWLGMISAD